ncbi:vacuolar ATPase assembly integral membrane protein VMA21 homolog isoform X2 [Cimex lectularius]|uniref:Vacuolar ATPase assembly integral membrane protein VMA21 homolog n=1 Tax=Cimex lectularius TaxID=79782 RepID=A0A8I6S4R2_CIMLE|nr:vacuolar ATPase assembly integral membrane protein VMA21 homolog isoform X2 [Cimex lectularius]
MDPGLQEMTDFRVFRTVFYYCIVIITLPVVTFFGSKVFIFEVMGLSNVPSNVYSAISAIAVLHVALGMYIYRAIAEGKPSKQD